MVDKKCLLVDLTQPILASAKKSPIIAQNVLTFDPLPNTPILPTLVCAYKMGFGSIVCFSY